MLITLLLVALLATIAAFVFLPETVIPYISLVAFLGIGGVYVLTSVSFYAIMLTLFVIMCFFMLLIIMIQQSKGSMGLGSMGGSAQMLFGGSGGQDLFQKTTWICGFFFMFGSLALTLAKTHEMKKFSYTKGIQRSMPKQSFEEIQAPVEEPAAEPEV
jgi:preprotein translocase subunit SecG